MRGIRWGMVLLAWSAISTARAVAGEPEGATYAGTEACLECHSEVESTLGPHGSAAFGRLANHGCESCHGPSSRHVDDPDVVENRPTMKGRTAEEIAATCQSCHSGREQFFWASSTHAVRGVTCTDCHSVHSPKSEDSRLVAATLVEQCFGCHKNVRAELWKNSHHPVREGKISCSDCHNPHGTQSAKMVRADSVNDLCFTCHTEKRGPFIWEHAPVRESCLNCHTPHGSNHIKLQKTSVPYLCQQCHANTRHPGTIYDDTKLPTADNPTTGSNRIFNRACLDCHAAIHGSNHPSSPYLAH